CMQVVEYPFTF
nr:immunoglobulin light chain junction region [Macaca mulatta]MOV85944.1 immunoglobulin light chain junction region [Macaca mulatta]